MFQGKFAVTIDPVKGRMSLPVKLRPLFAAPDGNFLTVTRAPHGCLLVLPRSSWLVKRERILQLPMDATDWKRMYVGNATDIEIDDAGRILIPAELRKPVGLGKEAVLMGIGDHLELWDEAAITKIEDGIVAANVPESMAKFTF
jgi:MraZ protein